VFNRAKYLFFRFSTTKQIFPFVFLVSLVLLVISIGMGAVFFGLYSDSALEAEGIDLLYGGGLIDTFWWSMKHVLDPGALSENYGAPIPVLLFGLFNSLMGLVITGAVIGFIVNSIQRTIDKAKSGSAAVVENSHLIMLGWNNKSIPILKQLLKFKEKPKVVILTSVDIKLVRIELKRESRFLKSLSVLPLHGSISLPGDLYRVALKKASHVLLLADGIDSDNLLYDVTTIKTLMLLNPLKKPNFTVNIVAEIINIENLYIANAASKLNHPIISSSDFISKTLVQCARYPGYAQIYSELFSTEKNEIEIISLPIEDGELFGDLARHIENATLIGVSWIEKKNGLDRRATVLNPDPNYDLASDDELIVIRSSGKNLKRLPNFSSTKIRESVHPSLFKTPSIRRALILSKSSSIGFTIKELGQHSSELIEITLACPEAAATASSIQDELKSNITGNVSLEPYEFNFKSISSLESLRLDSFDVIFIVADESDDKIDADDGTIMILLLLRELKARTKDIQFPPVIVEFLNNRSLDLWHDEILTDAVVSTEFLSMLFAQLVKKPFMEKIFKELLSAGGIEVSLRPVENYADITEAVEFQNLILSAQNINEIIIGITQESSSTPILINPPKNGIYQFFHGDKLIVLAEQIYN